MRNLIAALSLGIVLVSAVVQAEAVQSTSTPPPASSVFSNESEAGIVLSSGNSQVTTFNLKQLNAYVWDENTVKFNGRYLGSKTSGTENARYYTLGLRYDRKLSDSFGLFVAETFESDMFAGYDRRFNTDLGVQYTITKTETTNWFVEAGYRHLAEKLVSGVSNNRSNSRVYTEATHELQKGLSTKLWLEYIQSLANSKDALLSGEVSLSVQINDVFSLKTGYLVRYNNNPLAPAQKTDTVFTTALVAKF